MFCFVKLTGEHKKTLLKFSFCGSASLTQPQISHPSYNVNFDMVSYPSYNVNFDRVSYPSYNVNFDRVSYPSYNVNFDMVSYPSYNVNFDMVSYPSYDVNFDMVSHPSYNVNFDMVSYPSYNVNFDMASYPSFNVNFDIFHIPVIMLTLIWFQPRLRGHGGGPHNQVTLRNRGNERLTTWWRGRLNSTRITYKDINNIIRTSVSMATFKDICLLRHS